MSNTLADRVTQASKRGRDVIFISGTEAEAVSWADLHLQARGMAAGLQANGVGPGDHVAILGPTTRNLVAAIQATWLAGAAVVVLPLPMRMGSIDEFVEQTRVRIRNADARVVLIDSDLAPFVEARDGDAPMILLDAVGADAATFKAPRIKPGSLAIIQFTSGSTSDPKGVMLPHETVCANLDGIAKATDFRPDGNDPAADVMVSWLPLYHDMGLVGMLTLCMTTGCRLVLAGPQDFMASPSRWMEWVSTYHGTATAGPNFAWVLATRGLRRGDTLDLSHLRVALNGAEPVDPEAVEAFIESGARHQLRPGAVFPAFGMAELSIAGTFPVPLDGLRTDAVDGRVLETERYAAPGDPSAEGTRRLVKLGRPIPGLLIRVVDAESGRICGEREVGELEVKGSSVTSGYYKNEAATRAAMHDGWLRTGDLAYTVDGELVMCGRIKDMMIVAGRNVYPQDVEKAVAGVEGVRAGNVIAFSVDGRRGQEAIVVVAESKETDTAPVRTRVAERVRQTVGLAAREVVLVAPGSLPKTSSGKVQRSLCRSWYLDEALQPV